MNKQLEEMREQTSHMRLENAKLASKVGWLHAVLVS